MIGLDTPAVAESSTRWARQRWHAYPTASHMFTPMSFEMVGYDVFSPTRRVDVLRHNPVSCVSVSRSAADGGWETVVFWGDAEMVEDTWLEGDVVSAPLPKSTSELTFGFSTLASLPKERPVIHIPPVRSSGRASGARRHQEETGSTLSLSEGARPSRGDVRLVPCR